MNGARTAATVAALVGLWPIVAAADSPMSYLRTVGPAGNAATALGWGLGWISLGVMLVIGVLLLGAIFRRRRPPAQPNALTVQRDEGGMGWVYAGFAVTAAILLGCTIWTMVAIAAGTMPDRTALTVRIDAAQWWWGVRYLSDDPAEVIETANEIHIPVGQPVRFELTSRDVIHSFWIPKLGGKMDVIPGQTNAMWLQADEPGRYRGQCSEYCGAQHAHMAMQVVAEAPEAYRQWRAGQLRGALVPQDGSVRAGLAAFMDRCAVCHAVRGTRAGGSVGPDLSHLMSRATLAASLIPNTPGNLAAWIADPQAIKPGSRMPNLGLSGAELQSVLAFLQTLD